MSHYAWHNVTASSRITTRNAFAAMSFTAETFIFLYVGMDALDIEKWKMSKLSFRTAVATCSTMICLILLGRGAFVFLLSSISNFMNRNADRPSSITFKHQIIIWWAGLMRGAVSIALAFKQFPFNGITWDPLNATMVTTTVVVVLFSTIVFGVLTKTLINCLLPDHAYISHEEPKSPKEDMTLPLISLEESASVSMVRSKDGSSSVLEESTSVRPVCAKEGLSMLVERPVSTVHFYWRKFDDRYMRPIFGGPRGGV